MKVIWCGKIRNPYTRVGVKLSRGFLGKLKVATAFVSTGWRGRNRGK